MMGYEFLEVFAWFFEHEEEYDGLLRPVTRLKKVVCLNDCFVCPVWEFLVHARGVEVPDRSARHDPKSKGAVESKVQSCVGLLHEA